MRYSNPLTRTATQAITVVCAVVFVIFSFIYLHYYQPEFIGLEQDALSSGQTVYYPEWGTPIIIISLLGLGILIKSLFSFPIRVQALAWFPSALILGILTSIRFHEGSSSTGFVPWGWIIFCIFLYVLALISCRMFPDARSENQTLSTYLFPNILVLAFSFFCTCMLGNSSSSLHFELKAERLIAEGDFDGALRIGEHNLSFTPRLTSLRAYALSRRDRLGDSLFSYPLRAGSQDLLPDCPDTLVRGDIPSEIYEYLGACPAEKFSDPHVTHFLDFIYHRDSLPRPQVAQYLMCSYLLDKNLGKFTDTVVEVYDSLTAKLPRNYQEAVLLDTYLRNPQDSTFYGQEIFDEFSRFCDLKNSSASMGESYSSNLCVEDFSHTYWYYYYFIK